MRASGTEPLVRVMVEAETQQEADTVAERLAKLVRESSPTSPVSPGRG